jgi:hypothetical protein
MIASARDSKPVSGPVCERVTLLRDSQTVMAEIRDCGMLQEGHGAIGDDSSCAEVVTLLKYQDSNYPFCQVQVDLGSLILLLTEWRAVREWSQRALNLIRSECPEAYIV